MRLTFIREKGTPGYMKARKLFYGMMVLLFLALVVFFYLAGYLITGSAKNIGSVMAILSTLPMAKYVTLFVAVAGFKSLEKTEYDAMRSHTHEAGELLCELAVSSDRLKPVQFPFVYLHGNTVVALLLTKADNGAWESYVEGMLAAQGCQTRFKILTSKEAFENRVEGLSKTSEDPELTQKEKEALCALAY